MKSSFSVEFTNAAEVKALLDGLPKQFQAKAMRAMIKDSAKPLLEQARTNAPISAHPHKARGHWIQPGTLQKSIGVMDMLRSKLVTVIIGPRAKGAFGGYKGGWYAHFVEFDRRITWGKRSRWRGTAQVRKGTPFMAPAWASKREVVRYRFENNSLDIFNRFVNRMKSRGKL
jgi:hypothetical protein